MLPRLNGGVWMEERGDAGDWSGAGAGAGKGDLGSLSSFKAMLEVEDEWYLNNTNNNNKDLTFASSLLLHNQLDSSSSCSPSSSVFNNLDSSQVHYYLQQHHHNPSLSSLLLSNNNQGFDLASDIGLLENQGSSLMSSSSHMQPQTMPHLLENTTSFSGFRGVDMLRPLEPLSSVAAMPTLFQKKAAKNLSGYENERKRKLDGGGDEGDDLSLDGSGLPYDSDEFTENRNDKVDENGKNVGIGCNADGGGGKNKGKKKGLPAKNLMAERRRRKKLNDRLYMLRSVVPRISKMDRASILGDAIEYLQELLQRINNLHNELESLPPGSALTPAASTLHPLTPTPLTLPSRIKEELCPGLPSPNGQPARVEVRLREGRAVNIHMFCGRRPGLLLSTMMAVDNLGLDIQQAVISCFNGFAMDIFQAEQCKEGGDVHPDHIKAVLLESAGFHNMM